MTTVAWWLAGLLAAEVLGVLGLFAVMIAGQISDREEASQRSERR